jgi:hypothetical protein
MSILHSSKQAEIERMLLRLQEKEPKLITIPAGGQLKLANENPFRHLLMLMNTGSVELLYGAHKDEEIIPLPPGAVHAYQTHLFTIWLDDTPINIHHADWGWELHVKNPSSIEGKLILIEVS